VHDGRGEVPALLLWMPGPRSYTGEDVVEVHLPGAAVLLESLVHALVADGARPARAGEFTRRAFENGRIDLVRAEGVLELVRARSDDERRAGIELLAGGLSRAVAGVRDELADLCSLCEASLDFDESETGHVEPHVIESATRAARARLEQALADMAARPARVEGGTLVLLGPPNAGKSALFNALCGERALVSPEAGTTRDALVGRFEAGDDVLRLVDLPGYHEGRDDLDRAAMELARGVLAGADGLVVVLAAGRGLAGAAEALAAAPDGVPRWLAWNQVDREGVPQEAGPAIVQAVGANGATSVSATQGRGVRELAEALAGLVRAGSGAIGREVAARHRRALAEALRVLGEAEERARAGWPLDAVSSTLRGALDALDDLTGRTTTEDLLDRIFARFCLGK
jgi:tRNA modification GTPase